ncbi:hypothetical protein ColLi_13425 [Colletotrichum liriopes]|uniref:Uncharacterized protein n=1 Tax=Colletotrichum liriopes TaxID=708192 RepID=A0AA37H2A1_9PEZI|nr:hypothetical protein ColLi_13425 [Colletotrichum liriopes]
MNLGQITQVILALAVSLAGIFVYHRHRRGEFGEPERGMTLAPVVNVDVASDTYTWQPLDPLTDNICSSMLALRKLSPDRPDATPLPFEFLGLDPYAKPFSPIENSAHAGAKWHADAHRAVWDASARMRASVWSRYTAGDEGARDVVEALWHVGHMLTDDATRSRFLSELQPRLEPSRSILPWMPRSRHKETQAYCQEAWNSRGGVRG